MSTFLYRSYSALVLCTLFLFSSCQKFTEVPAPQNQILSDAVFSNDATANSAVVGLYSQFMRPHMYFANCGLSIYPALSADELYNTAPNADFDAVRINDISSNQTGVLVWLWTPVFEAIYQCNALLEGFSKPNGLTPSVQQQLRGEASFVRAFSYFYLVNLFGDLPLPLSTDYRMNAVLPRTSATNVYKQIIDDLQTAVENLPAQQINPTRTRPNKWAAQTLLARVYLYLGRWEDAVTTASFIIDNSDFVLGTNLESVFLAGSKETIWQLSPLGTTTYTSLGVQFIPSTASIRPTFSTTEDLWQSFEAGDKRASTWLKTVVIGGETYHYPFKYKQRAGMVSTEYHIVFRLAEPYLIRAEALAMLQQPELALEDLNRIHTRAGLTPLASLTDESLLRAIEKERFVELFTEWGHRWFDLKRTGRSDAVLGPLKGTSWQSTDVLYPVPLEELQRNVYLQQNPGY
ncbi:MAG TPA: RagB/SusD family nutrient uptake outer membrane protein [Chitinophagaceae bacterium]|nr:RagB/SusD family nutrient uptake outer membrane protein [Chitinophagaceae bacterium]